MKIIILHGDDTDSSYKRLRTFVDEAKKRNWEIIYDEISVTPSLFGKQRLNIILDYRKYVKMQFDGTLVIYNEGSLPQTFLKTLPADTKIEEFRLPVMLWRFLEEMIPGNSVKSLRTFHQILLREPVEFLFSIIARHFKELYWVGLDPTFMQYPSWRVSKLKSQSSKFSQEKLRKIISEFSRIDAEAKTGQTDLTTALDLFIIKNIE